MDSDTVPLQNEDFQEQQYTYPVFIPPVNSLDTITHINGPTLEYDTDCAICIESADPHNKQPVGKKRDIAYLACGHVYHYDCLMAWQQTIRNYYFNSIECCVCKQKVSLVGIWCTDGKYTPINTLNHISTIRDPLLHGKRILIRPDPPLQQQRPHRQQRQRRPLIAYIPGLSCCFKI